MTANSAFAGRGDQPLCLRFTATATERTASTPREHLRRPSDLADWLDAVELGVPTPEVSEELLLNARELRESIYRAARAVANGERISEEDRDHVNEWAASNAAVRVLDDTGAGWRFPAESAARSALAVVAVDAVDTLGGAKVGTIKVCSGTGCVAVFLDASRAGARRWCSMGTCGNRAKKDAMRIRRQA
ncbi:CGNR zinc finger domain-containing protein [Amycolatopsis sp. NPDC049252]|uniref:CGNR zinc finger domain-containing protein n=1 Tax=Amycolatopsis sp. NPDC049252 TaxID=3363933 RepID=UPI00371F2BFF